VWNASIALAVSPVEETKANAGVSAVINSGNSESQTVGGNGVVSYRKDADKVEWSGNGAFGRAKDPKTGTKSVNTKNWKSLLRYDRYITDRMSLFGLGHIGADTPSGFDLRVGGAAGFAHEIWKTEPDFFKYEIGFDFTKEYFSPIGSANVYSGRLFLQYKHKFSNWATFGQDVEALFNLKHGRDVRINSLTSLTMKMTEMVALQAGYAVRFDNVPVAGKKKTDTTTQVGIVVNFL
jgi:putative salt-induced outer membrane protein YdiY